MSTTAETFETLQRAILTTRDARDACVNPTHDHQTHLIVTGDMVGEPVAMFCWGQNGDEICGVQCHWDSSIEDFVHDDPTIPACDISTSTTVNPCRTKE